MTLIRQTGRPLLRSLTWASVLGLYVALTLRVIPQTSSRPLLVLSCAAMLLFLLLYSVLERTLLQLFAVAIGMTWGFVLTFSLVSINNPRVEILWSWIATALVAFPVGAVLFVLTPWLVARRGRGQRSSARIALWAIGGLVVGVVLGLLTRPSAPFVGQLSLETVLTRGANLSGMDILLKSTAEESFNQLLAVAIIGTVGGVLIGAYFTHQKGLSAAQGTTGITRAPGVAVEGVDTSNQPQSSAAVFCITCGTKFPDTAAFCPKCGSKRGG